MKKIGQLCSGDRFCYGMTGPYCFFWKTDYAVQFLLHWIEQRLRRFSEDDWPALGDFGCGCRRPLLPVKHVLIGGGTPNVDDMGARLAADLCEAIKKRFDLSCYVMICAPSKNEHIDILWQVGADEIGMNIEFYSDDAWNQYIPGKTKFIGKKRYLEALEYAVSRFGPINVRSILVAGLEAPEHTLKGAEKLASMGVMPILSPFRPLDGTESASVKGFDSRTYFDMYLEAYASSMHYGIPVGPTCIPCQNNTLALPLPGGVYHCY